MIAVKTDEIIDLNLARRNLEQKPCVNSNA